MINSQTNPKKSVWQLHDSKENIISLYYWPLVKETHQLLVDSPTKGQ